MSVFFTVLAVILIVGFVLLLSLGLFVALGIFLVFALVAGVIAMVFGGGFGDWNFSTSTSSSHVDDEIRDIPQKFNECLLNSDPELCRSKFTHWDAKDIELIRQLSKQVRSDLGRREKGSLVTHSSTENMNGEVTVTIDQETDFEKRDGVKEHYVLSNEGGEDLKIKDLKWDY